MRIRQVELLTEPMVSHLFVQFRTHPRVKRLRVQIKRGFELNENRRSGHRKLKIQLPAFQNTLCRAKEENLVPEDRATNLRAGSQRSRNGTSPERTEEELEESSL